MGWLASSNTCASTRRKLGLGVGRTVMRPGNWRPSCWQLKSLSPTAGKVWLSFKAVIWFSAQPCASTRSLMRWALSVSPPAALMPADRVMATMARATSTSMRVMPRERCARETRGSRRGGTAHPLEQRHLVERGLAGEHLERAQALRDHNQLPLAQPQYHLLRANHRLGAQH